MRVTRAIALMSASLFCLGLTTACDTATGSGGGDVAEDISGSDLPDGIIGGDVDGTNAPDDNVPDGLEVAPPLPDGDAPPEPDYDVGDLATLALCSDMCANVMEGCTDHPFPNQEECEAACEADIDADGKNLANWHCAMFTCDGDLCGFGDEGIEDQIEPNADCVEACGLVDACGAWEALDLPPNEIAVCIGQCTGISVGWGANTDPNAPTFDEMLSCIRDALNDDCDVDSAGMCIPGEGDVPPPEQHAMWCQEVCGGLTGDPTMEDYCAPDTGLGQAYSNPDVCVQECTDGDWYDAMRWWGCLMGNECGDPEHCHDLSENSPGCEGACWAQFDTCGPPEEGLPDAGTCAAFCTGFEANIGPFNEDAGGCVDEKLTEDMCGNQQVVDEVVWGCLIVASPDCEFICQSADACIPDEMKQGPDAWTIEACEFGCSVGGFGDTAMIADCVDQAGMDCAAVFECFPKDDYPEVDVPPEMIQGGCAGTCADLVENCDDQQDVAECAAECIAQANENPYWIGSYVCWSETCDKEACMGGPMPPGPGCQEACGGLDGCDLLGMLDLPEDQPGLCEVACAGAVAADPMFSYALPCIAETTWETCEPEAVMECLSGPGPPELDAAAICSYACSTLDGDPADPENNGCPEDSPAKQEMPDYMKCMEGCTMTNDPAQAMGMLGCLATSNCGWSAGTVQHCIEYPHEIVDSCVDSCGTMGEICVEVPGGPELCPSLCSGATLNFPEVASQEDAGQCIDAIDTCEEDGFGQILECQIAMPEFCEDTCDDVAACGLNEADWCHGYCAWGYLGADEDAAFPQCVDDADEDCDAIALCMEDDKEDDGGP
jgi:hypothetical protein